VVEWPFVDEILAAQIQVVRETQSAARTQAAAMRDAEVVRGTAHVTLKYSGAMVLSR